jgi:tRNA threonylcarbamoyladenosine biosynthesis protein TsaE
MATNILDRLRRGVETRSAKETQALARELADILPPDATLAMHGDLGSGKTTFVAGLAGAWGIAGPVTSPTFNLFSLYKGKRMLVHLDAYRLRGERDMDALMIEEFLRSPWCMAIEWPENIDGWVPQNALHIDMKDTGKGLRRIKLRSPQT